MNKKGLLLLCLITSHLYTMEETAKPKQKESAAEEQNLITQASQAYQTIFGQPADKEKLTSIANKQQFDQATANTIAAVVTELGIEELFSKFDSIKPEQLIATDSSKKFENYKTLLAHHAIARHIKEENPKRIAQFDQQIQSVRTLKNRYWLAGGAFLTCSLYCAYLYGKNHTWPNEFSVKALTSTIGSLISNATKDKHAIASIGGFITTLLCSAAGTKKHLEEQQFITGRTSYTQKIAALQDKIKDLTFQSTETTIKEILQKININLLVGQYSPTKPITIDPKDIVERTKSFCDDTSQEEIILNTNTLEQPIKIHITKLPHDSYCYTIDEPMSQSHIQSARTQKEELLDIIDTTQSFALRNQKPEPKKETTGSGSKKEGAQTSPPVIKRKIERASQPSQETADGQKPNQDPQDPNEIKDSLSKEEFEKKTNEAAEEIEKMQQDDSTATLSTTTEDQPISPRTQRKAQEISRIIVQEQKDQPLPKEVLKTLLGEYIDSPHSEDRHTSKKQQTDIGDNEGSPDTSAQEEESNSSEADKSEEEGEESEKQIEKDVNSTRNPQSKTTVLFGAPITTRNRSNSLPLTGIVGSDGSSSESDSEEKSLDETKEQKPQELGTPTSAESPAQSTRTVITAEDLSIQLAEQKPTEQDSPIVVNPATNTAAIVLDKLAEDLQTLNSNTTGKEQ